MPIIVRTRADGSQSFTARIRIKKGGAVTHDEAETFDRRTLALNWHERRLAELKAGTAPSAPDRDLTTLGELLVWYIESFQQISQWQRSKSADLKRLQGYALASKPAADITAAMLVDHIRARRAAGAGPATAVNDLVWIGVVLRAARGAKGMLALRPECVTEARETCRQLRLIARPKKRDRRPTDDELSKLAAYFARKDGRMHIPMADIVPFALHSARRESEICRLEWADIDRKAMTGIVRDAKNPRAKIGNHKTFKLTTEAMRIIDRQPKKGPYIFPYNSKSIGTAFARACGMLGIVDLHFHDLRHDATSRFFEAGYPIHEVALFTLHESWEELKRYANLRPEKMALREA